MTRKRSGGFTLVELMITVTIIAIIAAVGYPSYSSYVTRASREAVKSELLQLAAQQEKIYLNSSAYAISVTTAYNGTNGGGLGRTSGLSADSKYTFSITPLTAGTQTYTLTATPVVPSSQAGDGNISIDSAGTRSGTGCCATW